MQLLEGLARILLHRFQHLRELAPDNPLRSLQAASFAYPIALGPRTSLKGLTLIESGEPSPNSARLTALDFIPE